MGAGLSFNLMPRPSICQGLAFLKSAASNEMISLGIFVVLPVSLINLVGFDFIQIIHLIQMNEGLTPSLIGHKK